MLLVINGVELEFGLGGLEWLKAFGWEIHVDHGWTVSRTVGRDKGKTWVAPRLLGPWSPVV